MRPIRALDFIVISSWLSAVAATSVAFADPPSASNGVVSEETKTAARAKYSEGVALVKSAQWSDALAAFEAAEKLFPNPQITLSMGTADPW